MGQALRKEDWKPWHDEIKRYARRDTQGVTRDLEALEAHVKKLCELAPKDKAGCRQTNAIIYLNRLQTRLNGVKGYLSRV